MVDPKSWSDSRVVQPEQDLCTPICSHISVMPNTIGRTKNVRISGYIFSANASEQYRRNRKREDKHRIQMDLLLCKIHNVDLLNSIQLSSKENKDAHTKKKSPHLKATSPLPIIIIITIHRPETKMRKIHQHHHLLSSPPPFHPSLPFQNPSMCHPNTVPNLQARRTH